MWASVMPKYEHCWLGQAKPSVFTCFGAPRRLLTSRQGRTSVGAGLTPDEGGAAEATSGAIKWSAWLEKALDHGAHGLCF